MGFSYKPAKLNFLSRGSLIFLKFVDTSTMTNEWTVRVHKTGLHRWGRGWPDVRHLVLALAAATLLIACGSGGGGGGGTVAIPAPPKALEILSTVVNEGNLEVDASKPVDPRVTIRFAFDASLGASGIGTDKVQLSDGTRTYPIDIVIAGNTLTVVPIGNLRTSVSYTLTVKAGATSADGSVLRSDYVFKVRTVVAVFEAKQLTQLDRSLGGGTDTRIVIADINGDGRPDLVKIGLLYDPHGPTNAYTLSIYLQNTAGGFDNFQKVEHIVNKSRQTSHFNDLIVQDIDGDKKPELLVREIPSGYTPSEVAGIRIFKADAAGKYFASDFIVTPYVLGLQAMDVDGDGLLDLVGLNQPAYDTPAAFQILRQTSSGLTKLAPVVLPDGNYELGVGDLDLDGKPELIANRRFSNAGQAKSELLIYSQSAPATFSLNTALTNEAIGFCNSLDTCSGMKVVDTNGDGKVELVFVGRHYVFEASTNDVITFSRQPGGGLTKVSQVTLEYKDFHGDVYAVQDMDGDGVPDSLVFAESSFAILAGGSNFSWTFSNKIKSPVYDNMYAANVAIGDIDGDGLPDIILDSVNSGIVLARQVNFRRRP